MESKLDEDLVDRLRLIAHARHRAGHLSPADRPLRHAAAALDAVPDLARRGGGKAPALAPASDAEREIARVEKLGARYPGARAGLYPRLLAELEDAPPLLIAKGNLNLLDRPAVAIVGARNASAAACRFARGLAHDLGQQGLVVVSGLARGIDSAAHDGALESGTIGVDRRRDRHLLSARERGAAARRCASAGWCSPKCRRGPSRARATFPTATGSSPGCSAGTVVVEAAPRSGSLITARLAAEAGREVMAVPGSPLDPRAQGCNQLIRDGATLVQNAADVIEAIRPDRSRVSRSPPTPYDARAGAVDGDDGCSARSKSCSARRRCRSTRSSACRAPRAGAVQMALLELDLAGRLDRHAGGKVSLQDRLTSGIARPHLTRMREGNNREAGRRQIAGQGENHRKISGPRAPRAGLASAMCATCRPRTDRSIPTTVSRCCGRFRPTAPKQLKAITDEAKNADTLILATDPDREGEAISWHVQEVLRQKKALPANVQRVTFNAITKSAVTEAMKNPRGLDEDLIDAYRARRALDYLVGFTLSPILWRKLPGAKSAGRVQSVALRLIVDREREIEVFTPAGILVGQRDFRDRRPALHGAAGRSSTARRSTG